MRFPPPSLQFLQTSVAAKLKGLIVQGPAQFRRLAGQLLGRIDASDGWSHDGDATTSPALTLLHQVRTPPPMVQYSALLWWLRERWEGGGGGEI